MAVNLNHKVEQDGQVRARTRDPVAMQREEQLTKAFKTVKVFIGGLPVNMDEILVSGVKALDPNSSYHTDIVEKVKRQAVRALIPEVENTSPRLGSIKELTMRLQDAQRANSLSADDIILLRMMHKNEGKSFEDIARITGFLPITIERLIGPKKSQLRKKPAAHRGRKLDL